MVASLILMIFLLTGGYYVQVINPLSFLYLHLLFSFLSLGKLPPLNFEHNFVTHPQNSEVCPYLLKLSIMIHDLSINTSLRIKNFNVDANKMLCF